jgi:hypothetical protein
LASSDPAVAIAWAQALPASDARDLAVERAFGRWVERESEPALVWLAAREAEPDADRLIALWLSISEQVRHNPALARPWLELIRDPAIRARLADAPPSQ